MKSYALTVNGQTRRVEAGDPDTPLLWILRDWLVSQCSNVDF